MSKLVILCSSLAALTLSASAHAAEPRTSRIVQLIITPGERASEVTLAVADSSCSETESTRGDEHLSVKVCHEGGDAASPLYAFEVRREKGRTVQRFAARTRLAPGVRAVVGRLGQGELVLGVDAQLAER